MYLVYCLQHGSLIVRHQIFSGCNKLLMDEIHAWIFHRDQTRGCTFLKRWDCSQNIINKRRSILSSKTTNWSHLRIWACDNIMTCVMRVTLARTHFAKCKYMLMTHHEASGLPDETIMIGDSKAIPTHVALSPECFLHQPLKFRVWPNLRPGRMFENCLFP